MLLKKTDQEPLVLFLNQYITSSHRKVRGNQSFLSLSETA